MIVVTGKCADFIKQLNLASVVDSNVTFLYKASL